MPNGSSDGKIPATGEFPDGIKKDLINEHQADNHLVKWAVETGRLDPAIKSESVQARNRGRFTAIIYHKSVEEQRAISRELAHYCDEQERLQTEKLHRLQSRIVRAARAGTGRRRRVER